MKTKISFGGGKPDIEVTPPGVSMTLEQMSAINFMADIPFDQETYKFIVKQIGVMQEMKCDDPIHGKYTILGTIIKAKINDEHTKILIDIHGEEIKSD